MSSVALTAVGGHPSADRRGHLRVVAEGERRSRIRRVRLRITRRGRLTLTSTVGLLIAVLAASLLGVTGPAGASSAVLVQPGQTLSQIAAQQLPGVPLSQAVVDIQRANRLSGTSVAAGQELVIPGR
jgi:LysM repeat protein